MRRPTSVRPEVSLQTTLRDYWDEVADVAAAIDLTDLERAAVMLLTCQARGRVVFVIGNGGSAATASHFACDLSKGTRRDGPPTFHVVSLTDNVPLLTAWANDSGYDRVFSEQLTALARPGDLLVAISASGNSPNVVAAVDAARSCGMSVVSLSGRSGGRLAHLVDVLVNVPSDTIEVVEDAHLIVAHSLCVAVRERLASGEIPVPTTSLSVLPGRRAGR
ncbi:MAG: sugar isomerase [Thermomicrobiales bacterium]|jgi:D-sedoheptulose 7-phosphate isomerase|nr:sugar isomerase [Thermomicrobiales bacterium]